MVGTKGLLRGLGSGALWPIPPPRWPTTQPFCSGAPWCCGLVGAARGRAAVLTLIAGGVALAGAHTRTALFAMTIGLVVAGASVFMGHARVRRTMAMLGVAAPTGEGRR
jgi:hypothetical protein